MVLPVDIECGQSGLFSAGDSKTMIESCVIQVHIHVARLLTALRSHPKLHVYGAVF